jgi:glycerophosphoryl diester phosphodiesterase
LALNIAHRGASGTYPENTLSAFRAAIEIGVDLCELDVHETRDGAIVVIHDDNVDPTTDGPFHDIGISDCSLIRRAV